MRPRQTWDVFCRVIDNHGDLGVAWRLCADLAARGERLRLWVDKTAALAWMAPQGRPGVEVIEWTDPAPDLSPADVVVETFGCNPPPAFVRRMGARERPPVWFNLEYLSAEPYVERSHGLPSPVEVAPGQMLTKHFFYPGFGGCTGGLLREPGLLQAQRSFDRAAWLAENAVGVRPAERLVSLFCYDNPALDAMLDRLSATPTLLLVSPGAAAAQACALLGPSLSRGALRAMLLPYLSQTGYDRLLWACDLNCVRGEDSFVRAQWAGKPFLWQVYPQDDRVHAVKLNAFLDRLLADIDEPLARPLRDLWLGWNSLASLPAAWPPSAPWRAACGHWRDRLLDHPDLSTQLLGFIQKTR